MFHTYPGCLLATSWFSPSRCFSTSSHVGCRAADALKCRKNCFNCRPPSRCRHDSCVPSPTAAPHTLSPLDTDVTTSTRVVLQCGFLWTASPSLGITWMAVQYARRTTGSQCDFADLAPNAPLITMTTMTSCLLHSASSLQLPQRPSTCT